MDPGSPTWKASAPKLTLFCSLRSPISPFLSHTLFFLLPTLWSQVIYGVNCHLDSLSSHPYSSLAMSSSVVEATADASPHLRVSASKGQAAQATPDKTEPSTRIDPPETSAVDDHFFWTYTEEPHRSRRQAIIKAHPEVCIYFSVAFSAKESFIDICASFRSPSSADQSP